MKRGRRRTRVGILGCGTIGSELARFVDRELAGARVSALCDVRVETARELSASLKAKPAVVGLDRLVRMSDFVVECASGSVSAEAVKAAVSAGRDILVMSVGGLIGSEKLLEKARRKGMRVLIPSGAVCGIDGVRAAAMGGIRTAVLTTRKPPRGLEGAPYIRKKKIRLDRIRGEKVIFEGTARQAVKAFPANVNVSAVLSLAGIGARRTRVRIVTSPSYKRNTHEIEIEGKSGRITARTENVPSPGNPKTSYLAVLSAKAVLREALS